MASSKVINWAGNESTDIPELVIGKITRQMIGDIRGTFLPAPGRDGSWFFGEKRGRRKLTAECFIQADEISERRDAVMRVADWFDVEIETRLYVSDEPGVFYEAVVLEAPDVDEWREVGTFELVWAIGAYALDEDLSSETILADADYLHSWDPDVKVVTYPVIEITPTNGTLTEFTITTNGDALDYSGLVNDDETVTINSIGAVVTAGINQDTELTGAYDTLAVSMSGVSGKFPVLLPGTTNTINFLKVGGTATAITIYVEYRKRYRK